MTTANVQINGPEGNQFIVVTLHENSPEPAVLTCRLPDLQPSGKMFVGERLTPRKRANVDFIQLKRKSLDAIKRHDDDLKLALNRRMRLSMNTST